MTPRWYARLDVPIRTPAGQTIATLADARAYILALPESVQATEPWLAAIEAVLMAAERRGPILHANVGIGRAIQGADDSGRPRERIRKAKVNRIFR